MRSNRPATKVSLFGALLFTGAMIWVSTQIGAPVIHGEVRMLAVLPVFLAGLGILRAVICLLEFMVMLLDWKSTRTATGRSGTAGWELKKIFKPELTRKKRGPLWGLNAARDKTALFMDYLSNAMTQAPAGSGKGIYTVVPMAMSIGHSKILPDFKGELVCMLKKPLEARGEAVRVINPAGLWADRLGPSDRLSPLDTLADDLNRPGGLRDVPDDLREFGKQILPEPAERESENTYFREGSRMAIGFATLMEVMIEEHEASLSSVALLIEDRRRLEEHARWVIGVDLKGKPHPDGPFPIEQAEWAQKHTPEDVKAFAELVRARAANLLALMTGEDSRTFDSFITGAQQALAPFAFGRLASVMQKSTFRPDELKEGDQPSTLFMVADASRMEAYRSFLGLMQWTCMTAIKRHPNKERPVYFILDECTNYKINGLQDLLTWGRSYGLRLHVIFQDLAVFERVYGKTALDTLLSETEIKQFLPGQRSPRTLELVSKKLLGEQSVIAASTGMNQSGVRVQLSETGRPLLTEDELRRTKHGILFVRRLRPILFDPVSYAEIHPWRHQVDVNPFYNQAYRKPVKLRL